MKINHLFEEGEKHITFCFGRMNPPTIGHKQLLDTMSSVGGDMRIFVSQSQDPKKNPLDYSTKIAFMRKLFPDYSADIVEDSNLNTVMKVAAYLYNQGYRHATFVAGSDRLDDMKKMLEAYNGKEEGKKGPLPKETVYKFETLDFKSSGDREDGAEGVAGVSASAARAAAANGDLDAFAKATGAGEHTEELYKAVRKGMGISDDKEESMECRLANKLASLTEAPIEMDPEDPMNPMIVGTKSNPAKLKYRMLRAAKQLAELAQRAEGASPSEWQRIARNFKELSMNIDEIEHGLGELAKTRKKGGIKSRGIDPNIESIEEGDLVLKGHNVRGVIIDMIKDKIQNEKDMETLSRWLKMIAGKTISPRGQNSYTITGEDVVEAIQQFKEACKCKRK